MMMITYGFFMRTYYDIALTYLSSSWRLVLLAHFVDKLRQRGMKDDFHCGP